MSDLFKHKFRIAYSRSYLNDVSFMLKGNTLRVAFTSIISGARGLQTAYVTINDVLADKVKAYIADEREDSPYHTDILNLLQAAVGHEVWRLNNRRKATGSLEIYELDLPTELTARLNLMPKLDLWVVRGGDNDYAVISVRDRYLNWLEAEVDLDNDLQALDEHALAYILAEKAVEKLHRAAA
ncbi:hypothetical protein F9K94_21780 [Brucella tritici]|uniref:Uncharacterized protein n=1 Tax=Brucella tritici TaxID=94626 RepID=A0A7V7VQW4_9HYPH|nr:hypothetical protein [Brucella tritici]KAB2655185.1 hypothetical protein F9K94_21780 [Brucella tritici]